MAGRPLGRKNIRSYMAAEEMDRLRLNPIEGALKAIEELDELIKLNVDAFKSMRGYSQNGDQGSAYLANAVRAVSTKKDTYLTLAKFKYPTLTAIGVKDLTESNEEKKPMTTADAIEVLRRDPFCSSDLKELPTEKILNAMESTIKTPFLPSGNSDAKPD